MDPFSDLLERKGYLLLDGAMGTQLMEAGLAQGESPEAWNIDHPERIEAVHRAYVEAGSDLILTNSFGGTEYRLQLHDLQDRVEELNKAAAAIARLVADSYERPVLVGGSMGPSGQLLEPLGEMTPDQAQAAFERQARALAEGGVDLFWIETMSDLGEVRAAVAGARQAADLPIVATMTFDTHGHTMMGISPQQASEELEKLGLVALGANCGNGPQEIEVAAKAIRAAAPEALLIAKSNAGIPKLENGRPVYDATPGIMAEHARQAREIGCQLIGGCCGNTPEHIRAMARALGQLELQAPG